MSSKTIIRIAVLILLAIIVIFGGNARAIEQLTVYMPLIVDGVVQSPSPTTPPPSTTEPPVTTTEPPPSTTEPPPATTEPPPPTTEPPPTTTEPPPPTTEPPPGTTEPPFPIPNRNELIMESILNPGDLSQERIHFYAWSNFNLTGWTLWWWDTVDENKYLVYTFPNGYMTPNGAWDVFSKDDPDSYPYLYMGYDYPLFDGSACLMLYTPLDELFREICHGFIYYPDMEIVALHHDGNPQQEYVAIRNTGDQTINLGGDCYACGWNIQTQNKLTYYFPQGFTIAPSATVYLYTGTGTDNQFNLHWGLSFSVWGTDKCANLLDAQYATIDTMCNIP